MCSSSCPSFHAGVRDKLRATSGHAAAAGGAVSRSAFGQSESVSGQGGPSSSINSTSVSSMRAPLCQRAAKSGSSPRSGVHSTSRPCSSNTYAGGPDGNTHLDGTSPTNSVYRAPLISRRNAADGRAIVDPNAFISLIPAAATGGTNPPDTDRKYKKYAVPERTTTSSTPTVSDCRQPRARSGRCSIDSA